MTCPRCSSELRAQQREGIEIDACPQCRGIWLDSGELERLTTAENDYYRRDDDDDDDDDLDDDGDDGDGGQGRGGRQKKRGFFQNLMDNLGDIGG